MLTSAWASAWADRHASAWQTHGPLGSCPCWLLSRGLFARRPRRPCADGEPPQRLLCTWPRKARSACADSGHQPERVAVWLRDAQRGYCYRLQCSGPRAVATASQLSPPLLASSLESLSNAMLGYVLAHIYTKRFFKKRNGCGLSIKRSTDMRGCINARFTLHLCVCSIYGFNPLDRCNILAEVF